jgi:hypothetical protein
VKLIGAGLDPTVTVCAAGLSAMDCTLSVQAPVLSLPGGGVDPQVQAEPMRDARTIDNKERKQDPGAGSMEDISTQPPAQHSQHMQL